VNAAAMQVSAFAKPCSEQSFKRRLEIIVGIGALWRFVILAFKWRVHLLLNDSLYYDNQAANLIKGHGYVQPFSNPAQPGAEHGPLTSTLMAPLSWMQHAVPWQRSVTVLCGIATVAVIGFVGRRLAGDRAGLFASGLAAVYANLWINDGLVMSESVSMLTVALTLLVTLRFLETQRVRPAILVGVLIGLSALARSELILLLPLLALFLLMTVHGGAAHRLRLVSVVVGAAVLSLAPWVGYNVARFEKTVTLSTNDGTTIAGAYCDRVFSGPDIGGWSLLCLSDDPLDGTMKEPSVMSAHRRSVGLHYLRTHLDQMPKVEAARVGRTLDLFGLQNLVRQDVGEERWRWVSWLGIVEFWLLAPLAVVGLRRMRRPERWLLLLPCVCVLATTLAFYGAHRIRSSMEPTIVLAGGVLFSQLSLRRRGGSNGRGAPATTDGSSFDEANAAKSAVPPAGK